MIQTDLFSHEIDKKPNPSVEDADGFWIRAGMAMVGDLPWEEVTQPLVRHAEPK